jgi:hypothetical protein
MKASRSIASQMACRWRLSVHLKLSNCMMRWPFAGPFTTLMPFSRPSSSATSRSMFTTVRTSSSPAMNFALIVAGSGMIGSSQASIYGPSFT